MNWGVDFVRAMLIVVAMLNRIPNHVQDLFRRIFKLMDKNSKATNFILHDGENILRVVFDEKKKLLPSGLTSNAKFLTKHKNKDYGEESVIYLFFSKKTLRDSVRHQAILVHELMHYHDFDATNFFDKKFIDRTWNKLNKIYSSGDMEKFKVSARAGKHEERARRVQQLYKQSKGL